MDIPKLKVRIREKTGKGYAKKLRRKGFIPAVLYGPHLEESIPLEIELSEFKDLFSKLSEGGKVITLEIVNADENKEREVILKDVQRSWLKGGLQHVDFYEITRGEKISTTVPLRLVGEAKGAKKGGVVEQLVREIEIECTPEKIPPHIDIPLDDLDIGDSLRVKDLQVPPDIKVVTHPDEVIVSILSPVSEEEIEKLEEEKVMETQEVEVVRKEKKKEEEEEAKQEKKKE